MSKRVVHVSNMFVYDLHQVFEYFEIKLILIHIGNPFLLFSMILLQP